LSLAALRRPLVPLISCPLVAMRQLVVVCRLSVALSSCAALSSSRRAGRLLRVASHLSTYPVAPPSCHLVVPAGCCMSQTSVALFIWLHSPRPLVVPARCCVSRRICRPILLRRVFVIYPVAPRFRHLVARLASVAPSCCAASSSSYHAG
jgi:hypothetical protein